MKKFVVIALLIILLPIIGVFTFLKFADLNAYKPQIENVVRKYTNLNVKINGDLDVAISLKPTIEIEDVEVSDGESAAKIAQIGTALVQFSIMPLLHKEIVVDRVETANTHIYTGTEEYVTVNELAASMENADSPIKIEFATEVSGVDINGNVILSALNDIQKSNYNDVDIQADIQAMGYNINYNGFVKGLQEKLNAQGDYVISSKNSKINGKISADMNNEIPYVNLNVIGENIDVADFINNKKTADNSLDWLVSSAYAEEYIPNTTIPYEYLKMVDADISVDIKKIKAPSDIEVNNLTADIHLKNGVFKSEIKNADTMGVNINGSVSLDSAKSLPYIKLNVKGGTVDLNKLMNNKPSAAKKSSFNLFINEAQASQLMANTKIPYEYLKMANADVNVNIKKLLAPSNVELSNINTNLNLKNGVFKSNINSINAGGGNIKGNITLNSAQKTLAVNLTGANIVLQNVLKDYAQPDNQTMYVQKGGNTSFEIKINTAGADTDAYLANMNGQIISYMDESVLRIKSLQNLRGNIIVQILETLKLSVVNNDLKLKCAVVRGDITSGKVNFPKGIAFDAKDFYLVANGSFNLKNDKINLEIQPFSGKITDTNISSILGSLLKVEGTLNNSKIGLNQVQTAKSIIGAVATAGMYNVGDMMLSADAAPCHTALVGTAYENHFAADNSVTGAVSKGYTGTQDAVKQLGKDIKNQAKEIKNQTKDFIKGIFK